MFLVFTCSVYPNSLTIECHSKQYKQDNNLPLKKQPFPIHPLAANKNQTHSNRQQSAKKIATSSKSRSGDFARTRASEIHFTNKDTYLQRKSYFTQNNKTPHIFHNWIKTIAVRRRWNFHFKSRDFCASEFSEENLTNLFRVWSAVFGEQVLAGRATAFWWD